MLSNQMNDVIPVRPDEKLDETSLSGYLRGRLPGSDNALAVRQFGGGAANLTYLLDYGTHEYVLRRPPLGPVAASAHDMAREYRVLSVLHQAFPYAPRAFLYGEDESILGAPFFVMERRHGVLVRRKMPEEYAARPDAARRMSEALVDVLADFHAVDYEALGLGDLGKPAGFIDRQIEGWYRRWHAAKTADLADMGVVYDWLKATQPANTRVSLVHNDYKLDNVMLAADDPGRVVAVFDWDMCTLGDPLADLGALLTYWTEPNDPPYLQATAMMPLGEPGFLSRAELVARYAAKSGRPVGDIVFYHALGLFRLTVIVAQIYIRYARGQTQDSRFAAMEFMIPALARRARELAAA
jgi:aminoglycoside phosphotransferase (APT) family kinase protein